MSIHPGEVGNASGRARGYERPPVADDPAHAEQAILGEPPQNVPAERAVLGAMLLIGYSGALPSLLLDAGDFYAWPHQAIYGGIKSLVDEGIPPGPLQVFERLESRDLNSVGGAPYLHTLLESVATGATLDTDAQIVAVVAERRRTREHLVRALQGIHDGSPLDEVTTRLVGGITGNDEHSISIRDRAVDGGAFILDRPAGIPALWGHGDLVLWPEGEGLMVGGHQGLGKTTVAQQVILHQIGVRAGPFLGLPVRAADGRVVYLAMDRPAQAARSFRRMVTEVDRALLTERLGVWTGPLPFDPIAERRALAVWLRRKWPDAVSVVVDSVKDLAPGIVKDEVAAALNIAWQEVIAGGMDLMLLHHGRKAQSGAQRGVTIDDIYGNTWLTSGLGSVLLLDGQPGSQLVTVHHVKQPAESLDQFVIRHDPRCGVTVRHGDEVPTLVEQIAAAGQRGVTAADVAGVQYGSTSDANLKKAKRALGKLADQGQVEIRRGGVGPAGREPDRYVGIGAVSRP